MADIIRLNDDPHVQTQHLLPWYVTGALQGQELALVEAHLAECAECRQDAEIERTLARQVRALPIDVDRVWAALRARIEGGQSAQGKTGRGKTTSGKTTSGKTTPNKASLLARKIPIAWAIAAQAATLAILVPLMTLAPPRPQRLYRTLGSAPAGSGDLVVMLELGSSAASLRTILMRDEARLVDGPTSVDAYVLQARPGLRAAVLARLRSDSGVSLAEPIDGNEQ